MRTKEVSALKSLAWNSIETELAIKTIFGSLAALQYVDLSLVGAKEVNCSYFEVDEGLKSMSD